MFETNAQDAHRALQDWMDVFVEAARAIERARQFSAMANGIEQKRQSSASDQPTPTNNADNTVPEAARLQEFKQLASDAFSKAQVAGETDNQGAWETLRLADEHSTLAIDRFNDGSMDVNLIYSDELTQGTENALLLRTDAQDNTVSHGDLSSPELALAEEKLKGYLNQSVAQEQAQVKEAIINERTSISHPQIDNEPLPTPDFPEKATQKFEPPDLTDTAQLQPNAKTDEPINEVYDFWQDLEQARSSPAGMKVMDEMAQSKADLEQLARRAIELAGSTPSAIQNQGGDNFAQNFPNLAEQDNSRLLLKTNPDQSTIGVYASTEQLMVVYEPPPSYINDVKKNPGSQVILNIDSASGQQEIDDRSVQMATDHLQSIVQREEFNIEAGLNSKTTETNEVINSPTINRLSVEELSMLGSFEKQLANGKPQEAIELNEQNALSPSQDQLAIATAKNERLTELSNIDDLSLNELSNWAADLAKTEGSTIRMPSGERVAQIGTEEENVIVFQKRSQDEGNTVTAYLNSQEAGISDVPLLSDGQLKGQEPSVEQTEKARTILKDWIYDQFPEQVQMLAAQQSATTPSVENAAEIPPLTVQVGRDVVYSPEQPTELSKELQFQIKEVTTIPPSGQVEISQSPALEVRTGETVLLRQERTGDVSINEAYSYQLQQQQAQTTNPEIVKQTTQTDELKQESLPEIQAVNQTENIGLLVQNDLPAALSVANREIDSLPEGQSKTFLKSFMDGLSNLKNSMQQWVSEQVQQSQQRDVAQTALTLLDSGEGQTYEADRYTISQVGNERFQVSDLRGNSLLSFEKSSAGIKINESNLSEADGLQFERAKLNLQTNPSLLQGNSLQRLQSLDGLAPSGDREIVHSLQSRDLTRTANQFLKQMGVSRWDAGSKGSYNLEGNGKDYLKVESKKDGRGVVFELKDGQVFNRLESKDFKHFAQVKRTLDQDLAQSQQPQLMNTESKGMRIKR